MKSYTGTIQMKATKQFFPVMLFIRMSQLVLTFDSVDETLECDHSSESYWAELFFDVVYYAIQIGSNFWVYGWNPIVWLFRWELLSITFLWSCSICCTRWFYSSLSDSYVASYVFTKLCLYLDAVSVDVNSPIQFPFKRFTENHKLFKQENLSLARLASFGVRYSQRILEEKKNKAGRGKKGCDPE